MRLDLCGSIGDGSVATALKEYLFEIFPNLRSSQYEISSPATCQYNCYAYVAGERKLWWSPDELAFWPDGFEYDTRIDTVIGVLKWLGFEPCKTNAFEPGVDKVAIYGANDEAQHVAIQRSTLGGTWTSKLGDQHDIRHSLSALEDGDYGDVVCVLRRPKVGRRRRKRHQPDLT